MQTDLLATDEVLTEAAASLAPLPASATRLTAMLAADDVEIREVVEIVTYDPGLTAALLRAANSVLFGGRRPTATVRDAVMRLGFGNVVSVSMRAALATAFDTTVPLYALGRGEIFDHAVKAAVSAEALRTVAPNQVPAAALTAALLHDAGKLLLDEVFGHRSVELVGVLANRDGTLLVDAETDVFGTNHARAATYLVRHWKLPMSVLDGMVNHHDPQRGDRTAHAVFVADAMARDLDALLAAEQGAEAPTLEVPDHVAGVVELLGIDPGCYHDAVIDARRRYTLVRARAA
jgi:HD-like signal output (HDOD) protein